MMRNVPFGQQVEGLSLCHDKGYAIHLVFQTNDVDDLPLRPQICRKPSLRKCLRKFRTMNGDGYFLLGTAGQ